MMQMENPRQPKPTESFDVEPHPEEGTAEILYVLDQLEDMVGVSKRVPFSNKVMVEEEHFLDLVEQLRIAIPNEVRQAQRVVRDRERIIAEAQQEAARIIDASRSRAEYLISEHGVLNEARQRAEQLLEQAEERKKRELGEIDVYAMEQFNNASQAIQDGLNIIERALHQTLSEIDQAKDSVGR